MRWAAVALSGLLPLAAVAALIAFLLHEMGYSWPWAAGLGGGLVVGALVVLYKRLP